MVGAVSRKRQKGGVQPPDVLRLSASTASTFELRERAKKTLSVNAPRHGFDLNPHPICSTRGDGGIELVDHLVEMVSVEDTNTIEAVTAQTEILLRVKGRALREPRSRS